MTLVPVASWLSFAALASLLLGLSGCGDDFAEFSTSEAGAAARGGSAGSGTSDGGTRSVYLPPTAGMAGNAVQGGSGGAPMVGIGSAGSGGALPLAGAGGDEAQGGDSGVGGDGPQPPSAQLDLIDDIEGAFPTLPVRDGRNGAWFSVHDETWGQAAPVSAVAEKRGASRFSAGIHGGGFTDWGAQMGVTLKWPSAAYDASKYCGLRLLIKGSGAGWTLLVSDRSSVPQGGVCNGYDWDSDQGCYQFVGKKVAVSGAWKELVVRFDELRLMRNPQSSRRLETDALYDIVFNFHDAGGGSFELMVDDLAFIAKGSPACE